MALIARYTGMQATSALLLPQKGHSLCSEPNSHQGSQVPMPEIMYPASKKKRTIAPKKHKTNKKKKKRTRDRMKLTANKNHIVYITRTTAPYKQHIYPYKKTV